MAEQIFVDRTDGQWQTLDWLSGAELLALAEPVPGGSIHRLKMVAGSEIPAHTHPSDEYIYVIDGEIQTGERLCRAGTFWCTPAWVRQGPHRAITDVEILTIRLGSMGSFC
jgi:quercetin dioxygenase-like cupin family protein